MNTSVNSAAKSVRFTATDMIVELQDGRAISVPLAWFPILADATPRQREKARISKSGAGIHWDELDEDISVAGLLAGNGDLTVRASVAHG